MDTSKEYIDMCAKAKEMQHEELHTRDFAVDKKGELIFIHSHLTSLTLDELIWLPRQDQLQKMIKYKYGDRTISLLNNFIQFTRVCYAHGKYWSMEQLWLAFVMKEKYNKIWDGEDWAKIK